MGTYGRFGRRFAFLRSSSLVSSSVRRFLRSERRLSSVIGGGAATSRVLCCGSWGFDQQDGFLAIGFGKLCKARSEIGRDSGLADAALGVGDHQDLRAGNVRIGLDLRWRDRVDDPDSSALPLPPAAGFCPLHIA